MKCLVLFPYPVELDGQSLQGYFLYKGLLNLGIQAVPCDFANGIQKEFYLRHFKPDVCFGVGYWGNVPEVVREPLNFGIKTVPWFNSDSWVANYLEDFNKLELMFTTSEWVKSVYERDGVDVSKIVPMHIGVDTDLFKPINNQEINLAVRRMLGVRDNEKMILTIGGDVTSKGAQEMFKALAQVDKEFKEWKYVCKSWPSECAENWREQEKKLAEELGIRDKIIFINDIFSQEFMVNVLNACDIYAAPSRLEGFGMIQVEAMACGKPVISINKMGPAETIVHGKTGFLTRVAEEIKLEEEWAYPGMGFSTKQIIKFDKPKTFGFRADIKDLADYSLKLLTDEELRKKIGEQAREHAVKNFDYRDIAKKIAEITIEKLGLKISVPQKKQAQNS